MGQPHNIERWGGISRDGFADHFTVDDYATASSDGHTVQAQQDSWLVAGESSIIVQATSGHGFESGQSESGAFVDGSPIFVFDDQMSGDATVPSRDWSGTDDNIFELEKVPLLPLHPLSNTIRQISGLVGIPVIEPTSELGDGQNNQHVLQHSLSFGSQTLQPDRDSVNSVAGNGQWPMVRGHRSMVIGHPSIDSDHSTLNIEHSPLSAEQLSLLNQATITIADLADGYLALTLGTTITLDTDAAGYG